MLQPSFNVSAFSETFSRLPNFVFVNSTSKRDLPMDPKHFPNCCTDSHNQYTFRCHLGQIDDSSLFSDDDVKDLAA